MQKNRPALWLLFSGVLILIGGLIALPGLSTTAQEATPLPIALPSRATASPTPAPGVTSTPTRNIPLLEATATLPGIAIEVRDKTVPGNVRQAPDTNSEKIGQIKPGEFYQAITRSGNWIQILFNQNGYEYGWVYVDIVVVKGNINLIPQNGNAPTANVVTVQAAQTGTAQVQGAARTPGGFGSATVARGSATGQFLRIAGTTLEPTLGGPRPTFTYPAPFAEATLAPRNAGLTQSGLPPIVPILALAVLGIFGLLIGSLRRL